MSRHHRAPSLVLALLILLTSGCSTTGDLDLDLVESPIAAWGYVVYNDEPLLEAGEGIAFVEHVYPGGVAVGLIDELEDPSRASVVVSSEGLISPNICSWSIDQDTGLIGIWVWNAVEEDLVYGDFTFIVLVEASDDDSL